MSTISRKSALPVKRSGFDAEADIVVVGGGAGDAIVDAAATSARRKLLQPIVAELARPPNSCRHLVFLPGPRFAVLFALRTERLSLRAQPLMISPLCR